MQFLMDEVTKLSRGMAGPARYQRAERPMLNGLTLVQVLFWPRSFEMNLY